MALAHFRAGLQPVFAFQRFFGCHGGTGAFKGVAQLTEMLRRGARAIGRERAPKGKTEKQDQHADQAECGQSGGAESVIGPPRARE